MFQSLPNILTLVRIGILPFIIALFFSVQAWAIWSCFGLYVVGALTDFFDGWLARTYNLTSEFGKFLDPIADKIFVASIMIMLIASDRIEGIWVICVVIILMREFLVAGLREFLAPKGLKLPVTQLAKWKTASQMIAIGLLILGPLYSLLSLVGIVFLLIACILTIATGTLYLKSAQHVLYQ